MQHFWEIVASNSLLVLVLATGVALLGRLWKNPLCLHFFWVLVLLKLLTPPVLNVPIALPAVWVLSIAQPPATDIHLIHPSQIEITRPQPVSNTAGPGTVPIFASEKTGLYPSLPSMADYQEIWWLSILGWTWFVGIVLLASYQAYRIVRFHRLLRGSQPAPSAILHMAEGIAKQLGLSRVPLIRLLPVRVSPLVWSLGSRPRVYLPVALFDNLDTAAQEAILAHELAHVRRKDHWVRLLETVIITFFWWHPVVWLAARRLHELEDQCCDAMAVDLAPHSAKSYATALMDTLDFLCERSIVAPLGATAAKSSISLRRRIAMLKNRSWTARWTFGRFAILLAVAALPMAVAFGQKPPEATNKTPPDIVERRAVNKSVKDFPEKVDLSTPESATAALHRTFGDPDPKSSLDLSAWKYSSRDVADIKRKMDSHKNEMAKTYKAYRNAEIIEVLTYRDGLAEVISKLNYSKGSPDPYSARTVVRIDGVWKNFGENRFASVEEARKDFNRIKDKLFANYRKVLDGIAKKHPIRLEAGDLSSSRPKRSAAIAPGEQMGISVEKADLMGRVEWLFMHGAQDVTARKSIEWGDVEKDKDGNRMIRYKFEATIWGKDVIIANQVFTFDAKGNLLNVKDVEGFPK